MNCNWNRCCFLVVVIRVSWSLLGVVGSGVFRLIVLLSRICGG